MPMQLWISHTGEVPIPEQIATQVILGILGDELRPGQRMPSTRALARRFKIHPNTVSAGYRQLERDGWVEARPGSGVYVRRNATESVAENSEASIDRSIAVLFQSARKQGIPVAELRARLQRWLAMQPPDHFLVVEPDEELRRIVMHELQQAVSLPVKGCSLEDCAQPDVVERSIPVALPSKAEKVRQALPPTIEMIALRVRSAPASLARHLPAPAAALVGVASRWDAFRALANTMLISAGFEQDALLFRDAKIPGWQQGLEQTAGVVCDALTAAELTGTVRPVCFSLIALESIDELRRYRQFIDEAEEAGAVTDDGAVAEVSQAET